MELQLYIKNIEGCLYIMDLIAVTRQNNKCNNLILCETILEVDYLQITSTFNKTLISKRK